HHCRATPLHCSSAFCSALTCRSSSTSRAWFLDRANSDTNSPSMRENSGLEVVIGGGGGNVRAGFAHAAAVSCFPCKEQANTGDRLQAPRPSAPRKWPKYKAKSPPPLPARNGLHAHNGDEQARVPTVRTRTAASRDRDGEARPLIGSMKNNGSRAAPIDSMNKKQWAIERIN